MKTKIKYFLMAFALFFTLASYNPLIVHATEGEPTAEGEGETTPEGEGEEQSSFQAADYVINLPVVPNVYLSVFTDYEWYNSRYAVAHVLVTDIANSGAFEVQSIRAKLGRNGNWFDITELKEIVISENGSVYIQITDTEGNIYEKSVNITCFDYEKPYLNAAVVDGVLKIQPYDDLSGIYAVYINGYEFKAEDFIRGTLSVRLQQFDGTYPYFAVQAVDKANNISELYTCENPYYVAPDVETDEYPAMQLPISAMPTAPTTAVGDVTEHMETDISGNSVEPVYSSDTGKVFYTIETENGKVFYLIIDRDGNTEQAYFLTEISENDLLNVTSDTNQTMPVNSTATNNNNGMLPPVETPPAVTESNMSDAQKEAVGIEEEEEKEPEPVSDNTVSENKTSGIPADQMGNILIGVGAVIVIIIAYFVKVKGKKKGGKQTDEAIDEEDDDIDEEE